MRERRGEGERRNNRYNRQLQMESSSQPATVPMGPSKRDTDHHWGLDRTVTSHGLISFIGEGGKGHTRSNQSPAGNNVLDT